jgi:acetyl-CoA carboxylase carboxyl transferase subunit alpha
MLEYSVYSVISPEGCAAILWKKSGDLGTAEFTKAADALKLTAHDLLRFKVIDEVIPESPGGAHRDFLGTAEKIADAVMKALEELKAKTPARIVEERYRRLRRIGVFEEETVAEVNRGAG